MVARKASLLVIPHNITYLNEAFLKEKNLSEILSVICMIKINLKASLI